MREVYRATCRARRKVNREGNAYEVYYVAIPFEYVKALKLKAGDPVHVTLEV